MADPHSAPDVIDGDAVASSSGGGAIRTIAAAVFSPPPADAVFGYFYALDLLRGLAALAILFWHYSHFFTSGSMAVSHGPVDYPFYRHFSLIYEHGGNAVQLFWMISGFTLASVYTRRVLSGRTFLVHRFARLYPLHLLTLLVLAALQFVALRTLGHWLIYDNNDLPHFLDQLFLLIAWGPEIRFSFNGPVWTVSTELLLYAAFWMLLPRLFVRGAAVPFILAAVCQALSHVGQFAHIFQAFFYFFVGCGLYPVFLACRSRPVARALATALPLALALLVLAGLRWHAVGLGSLLLFVGLVLATSFVDSERHGPRPSRAMKWLGDNTYGVYLWHVPTQVVILLAARLMGWSDALFLSPWFFVGFFALILLMARASFLLFERPWRVRLNKYFGGLRGKARPVLPAFTVGEARSTRLSSGERPRSPSERAG